MPSAEVILAAATTTANDWHALAIVWHVLLASFILTLGIGAHPRGALLGYLLILPLVSVSLLAWNSGNPFNGLMFALLAVALTLVARRFPPRRIQFMTSAWFAPGTLVVVFGWIYPHFLSTDRWMTYAYAAPFGLLPCPTLSVLIGMTLVLGMHRSVAWSMPLIVGGVVYGVIGVFALGVALDYGLLAGTAMLATAMVSDLICHRAAPHEGAISSPAG
jgi:hypothetical protein